jgi:hypothetical protein
MITNYIKYTDELKILNAERKIYSEKLREIGKKRDDIIREITKDSYDYMIEQLSQKLKKGQYKRMNDSNPYIGDVRYLTEDYFLFNDEIGIYVTPNRTYSTGIKVDIFYVKDSKVKISDKTLTWVYSGGGITIDIFIDRIMSELDRVYKYRKEAELKRTAKKYNL